MRNRQTKVDVFIGVRVSSETAKAIREYADRKGSTQSQVIREILEDVIAAYNLMDERQVELDGKAITYMLNELPDAKPEEFEHLAEVAIKVARIRRGEPDLKVVPVTEERGSYGIQSLSEKR